MNDAVDVYNNELNEAGSKEQFEITVSTHAQNSIVSCVVKKKCKSAYVVFEGHASCDADMFY